MTRTFRRLAVRRALSPIVASWSVACAAAGDGAAGGLEDRPGTRVEGWTVGTAEHVALWYHGMAYAAEAAPAAAEDEAVLPAFRPGYVDEIVAVKRERDVYPTVLDRRAAEFGEVFAADGRLDGLRFLPLYFRDADALFSSIELWADAGGDPRRTGSADAARVVAFLSNLFPRRAERRVVVQWASVLRTEREAFYAVYWRGRSPALTRVESAVQREWDALAPELADYLDYMQLEGGGLLLTPALGIEGRTVTGGPTPPRVAVLEPSPGDADAAVSSFVHELLYPLVGEVIRDYVAPVRIREIGEERLAARAAVRGGAMLLERTAPARVERYRRYFLRWAEGRAPANGDGGAGTTPFEDAFPLPPELERGLRDAVDGAVAGI